MKNFKQIAFGTMICALAIGFSSFTSTHKLAPQNYTFVHATHGISNTKADYTYVALPDGCDQGTDICTSVWSQNETPTAGSHPQSHATQVSISDGEYN